MLRTYDSELGNEFAPALSRRFRHSAWITPRLAGRGPIGGGGSGFGATGRARCLDLPPTEAGRGMFCAEERRSRARLARTAVGERAFVVAAPA
jgi:hypothetical protein